MEPRSEPTAEPTGSRRSSLGQTTWRMMRHKLPAAVVVSLMLTATPAAVAGWTNPGTGTGESSAIKVGAGHAPVASANGNSVDLTWDPAMLSTGDPVTAYTVVRYDSSGNTEQVIASGTCVSAVSGTECSETLVPSGTWKYSVTPTHGGWKGAESPKTTVSVSIPTLSLSPTDTRTPNTLSGSISNFTGGDTLRFRLDSPDGPELAGTVDGSSTPALVPLSGGASVTVVVPGGTPEGSHTIYAVASLSGQSAGAAIVVDDTPPPIPVLTSTPEIETTATAAQFEFTTAEAGVVFECRLGGGYSECSSPRSYSELDDGTHTFEVRARDAVGNYSAAASFTWTIDTNAPNVAITFPQEGAAYNNSTYSAGCSTSSAGDLCGTSGTDAEDVRISIRSGAGNYWNGAAFSSGSEILFAATGTANWSYGFAASDFPADDTYTIRAVARDALGNSRSTSTTFTIDRTAPSGTDVQTANSSGGTVGKAEAGDTITFTYSERIDPTTLLAGWDGAQTDVVVRLYHRVTLLLVPDTDVLQVWDASDSTQVQLGQVDLGATDYVSANVAFGASGAPATMIQSGSSITVTLGTPGNPGAVTTALLPGSMTWIPSASARDLAGNNSLTTGVTESGSSDREF